MNLEGLVLGLAGIGAGSLLAVFGVRLFWILLGLWGGIVGFLAGAAIVAAATGAGFLGSAAGWIGGAVGAAVLASIAASVYWASIIVLCIGVGWSIGSGAAVILGLEPGPGLALGLSVAGMLTVLAIAMRVPVVLVAVLTAFGGSGYAITGAMLLLGRIGVADLAGGSIGALRDQPLALLTWLAIGVAATAYQLVVAQEAGQRLLDPLDRDRAEAAS